jgi:histidinol phosphatase-like PHP family hydrolase
MFESRGYRAIGLTDHFDPVLTPDKLRQTREELEELETRMDVYVGTEACVYLPGWPREELARLRSRHLDFCILSPSHHPSGKEAERFARLPLDVQAQRVLDSFIESVRTDLADAIAHPFAYGLGQIPRRDEVLSSIDDSDLMWALELARRNEIAMEFSPRVLGLSDAFISRLVRLCKEARLDFSIGGDAHSLESIGNDGLVLPLVRKFGIGEDHIWFPARSR